MPDDPFEILRLPPKFDLDTASIERAYLRESRLLHPDHAPQNPQLDHLLDPSASEDAEAQLAKLSAARRTLARGETRARALLDRFTRSWRVTQPTSDPDRLSPAFLAQILETREQIEADLATKDRTQRAHWESWALAERQRYAGEITTCFDGVADQPAPHDAADRIHKARAVLNEWRYIERLLEQLDDQPDAAP